MFDEVSKHSGLFQLIHKLAFATRWAPKLQDLKEFVQHPYWQHSDWGLFIFPWLLPPIWKMRRSRSVSDAWLKGEGFEPPVSSRSTDNQALFGLCAALYDLERSPGSRQGSLWSLLASSSSILISAFYKECLSRLRRPCIMKDPDDSKSSPNFSFSAHGHQCLYWSTDPLQKSKGRSANFW